MAKTELIAKKYAEALVAVESSQKILDDLKLVQTTIQESADLKNSLENPSVKEEDKAAIVAKVFASLSANALNLLKLCVQKRRSDILADLADHYEAAFLNQQGIELATFETAGSMSDSEVADIKAQLERIFDKSIQVQNKENPDLIAGLKIKVSNKVIDYSLKTKIKKLRQTLKS